MRFLAAFILGAALVFFWGAPSPAAAKKEPANVISVRVDGMVCYACSYGIEKGMKTNKLGKKYTMDLDQGRFNIRLSPADAIPAPGVLAKIIEDASFTYRGAALEIDGKVVPKESGYGVLFPASGQNLSVEVDEKLIPTLAPAEQNCRLKLEASPGKKSWVLLEAKPLADSNKSTKK